MLSMHTGKTLGFTPWVRAWLHTLWCCLSVPAQTYSNHHRTYRACIAGNARSLFARSLFDSPPRSIFPDHAPLPAAWHHPPYKKDGYKGAAAGPL